MYTTNNMEIDLSGAFILANTRHHPVESVPGMDLSHTDQVQRRRVRGERRMQGNTVEVNTIGDADGALSEDFSGIGEGDHRVHILIKAMAEKLVDLQLHALFGREVPELLIIWIGRNLGYRANAGLTQSPEKAYQPGIGILEAAGIDELDAFAEAIVIDAIVAQPLAQTCPDARSIVLNHLSIDETAAMPRWRKVIVTQAHIVTILTKSFHLIVNLFRDSTMLRKAMIDKKQYFHSAKIAKKFGIMKNKS